MAELTPGRSCLLPHSAFLRARRLLAVAWLRWRIFVNSTFRRRSGTKRRAVGMRSAILLRLIVWPFLALMVIGPVVGSGYLRMEP